MVAVGDVDGVELQRFLLEVVKDRRGIGSGVENAGAAPVPEDKGVHSRMTEWGYDLHKLFGWADAGLVVGEVGESRG